MLHLVKLVKERERKLGKSVNVSNLQVCTSRHVLFATLQATLGQPQELLRCGYSCPLKRLSVKGGCTAEILAFYAGHGL